jgi:stage III sporulation protein AG
MNADTLKNFFKNKNNRYILIIFIIGIVLMLVSGGAKHKERTEDMHEEEKRLESIISDIKGAGEVSVMITYYSGTGKELAYETRTNRASRDESVTENVDKQAVVTSGEPVVLREVYPEVKGVIVTASGASDPRVKAEISEAVCASLGVAAHKVCIFEKK